MWQDFLLACAAYAEEEPLRGEIVAEARENVTRLSQHPSLVLWNGGNENIWGFEDWGWKEPLAGRTWGLGYYDEIFPDIVAELDPTRPYCPGSPYSFKGGIHPNDPDFGSHAHLGRVEPARLHPLRDVLARGSSPSSDSRGHPPGRRSPRRSTTNR